jgi:hypothetical protein
MHGRLEVYLRGEHLKGDLYQTQLEIIEKGKNTLAYFAELSVRKKREYSRNYCSIVIS